MSPAAAWPALGGSAPDHAVDRGPGKDQCRRPSPLNDAPAPGRDRPSSIVGDDQAVDRSTGDVRAELGEGGRISPPAHTTPGPSVATFAPWRDDDARDDDSIDPNGHAAYNAT